MVLLRSIADISRDAVKVWICTKHPGLAVRARLPVKLICIREFAGPQLGHSVIGASESTMTSFPRARYLQLHRTVLTMPQA